MSVFVPSSIQQIRFVYSCNVETDAACSSTEISLNEISWIGKAEWNAWQNGRMDIWVDVQHPLTTNSLEELDTWLRRFMSERGVLVE